MAAGWWSYLSSKFDYRLSTIVSVLYQSLEYCQCFRNKNYINFNYFYLSSYRLSPQNPYPIPDEDCLEAVNYILDHASQLKIDPHRLAVGGDSAGGNLAASISLRMRDRIKAQLVLVPALQFFSFNTSSVQENQQYFAKTSNSLSQLVFWTNYINCSVNYVHDILKSTHTSPSLKTSRLAQRVDQNIWMDKSHINTKGFKDLTQKTDIGRTDISPDFISKMTDPYLSPLMAEDSLLRGLPRAYIMVTGYDIIRDDGIMYANRLRHNGVPVHLVNHRTSFHNALLLVEGPLALGISAETVNSITNFMQTYI